MKITPAEQAAYDAGYRDGESNVNADWFHALSEFLDLDIDDADIDGPMNTVQAINRAIARARRVSTR